MWPALLTRLLRRRMLFILLILLTFIYLVLQLLGKRIAWRSLQYEEPVIQRTRPLIWRSLQQSLALGTEVVDELTAQNHSVALETGCRNSVQGSDVIVDERGFVCTRDKMLANGCCDIYTDSVSYNCHSCNQTTHCCRIYEYCVSCCLHPDKRPLLELVLSQIRGRQALVFASVPDQFELCLVKCRTSSHSVQHENRYRDAVYKYCYGHTTAHESEIEVLGGLFPAE